MSTTISYKGNTLATVNNNTKTLTTAGKYMEADVILTDTTRTVRVKVNGQGNATNCYVMHNNVKYYSMGDMFYVANGDQLTFVANCSADGYSSFVLNGVEQNTGGATTYSKTITFSSSYDYVVYMYYYDDSGYIETNIAACEEVTIVYTKHWDASYQLTGIDCNFTYSDVSVFANSYGYLNINYYVKIYDDDPYQGLYMSGIGVGTAFPSGAVQFRYISPYGNSTSITANNIRHNSNGTIVEV